MKNCSVAFCLIILFLNSCTADDPTVSEDTDSSAIVPRDNCIETTRLTYTEDVSTCTPLETDYQPRTAEDTWDACISDDNTYHRIQESISSIARVEAYDQIAALLWNNPNVPTVQDFLDARDALDSEEGLGSRLDRRYDVHYTAPADGTSCEDPGVAEANPLYCVGPGRLRPLINDAFAAAQIGGDRQVQAEIIHAALQWFLYVSPIKEGTTCTDTAKDCDSAWAYYTGGTQREAPIGLAAEIDETAPETHDRAYDGALALRCWRDLDPEEVATNLALRDQALAQYDAALIHGMALLVRQRFEAIAGCESNIEKRAALAGLRVLVPLMNRDFQSRDAAAAESVLGQMGRSIDEIDVDAAIAAIDSAYDCP